jgi:dTDP-4-dehydrorhamnose 3,5-epimerase-like enzyme
MKIIPTSIPDVLIIEPTLFGDERGFFLESFNQRAFEKQTGVRQKMCCAVCTIKSVSRKASWCG